MTITKRLSMPDQAIRTRVERLLRGDFRVDDLTRIFLYIRDRCDGRESIQEIGDFVAHHDERNKGIVTRAVRDWFHIVRFIMPYFDEGGPYDFDFEKLPPNTPQYLTAVLPRIDKATIRKRTGYNRSEARRLLPSTIAALVKNADGTYNARNTPLSRKQQLLLNCLVGYVVSWPAFDGNRLFSDLEASLRRLSLLRRSEVQTFQRLRPTILLFAVAVMHNCIVRMEDETPVRLYAYAAPEFTGDRTSLRDIATYPCSGEKKVEVMAAIPVKRGGITIFLSSAIFITDLDVTDSCDASLITMKDWNCDLEIGEDQLLRPLG